MGRAIRAIASVLDIEESDVPEFKVLRYSFGYWVILMALDDEFGIEINPESQVHLSDECPVVMERIQKLLREHGVEL